MSNPTKVDTVAKSMIKFVRVKIVDLLVKFLERGSETVGTVGGVSVRETKLMLSHSDASDIIV